MSLRILLLVGSLLFMAAGLEIVLRVIGGRVGGAVIMDRSQVFYRPEPTRRHPWSQGNTNILRVAVIGDSFTWGQGVQVRDCYGSGLEWLLNLNDGVRPAEVVVYAKCGTSTYQQRVLLREALDTKPDLVILGICLNDAENWKDPATLMKWRHRNAGAGALDKGDS